MSAGTEDPTILWPFFVYGAAVLVLVGIMIGLSYILGQRHNERQTGEPYESGVLLTGSARMRFSIHFYIVAMFFVIFDLEAIFILSWAIAFEELGWFGYINALVFIFVLVAVLIYEWRIGALDFATSGKEIIKVYKEKNKKDKTS